jgi:hypothetical protein
LVRRAEQIAHGAHERRAEPEADQIHHQQQQGAGHHALVGPDFILHKRDG